MVDLFLPRCELLLLLGIESKAAKPWLPRLVLLLLLLLLLCGASNAANALKSPVDGCCR